MSRIFASAVRCAALTALAVSLWASVGIGQTTSGEVTGQVTDKTGAIVVGAEVQLTNVLQNTAQRTKTNGAGLYVFASVTPGQYQIRITHAGFKQVDILSLIVNVQDHLQENVELAVGSVTESVTVNANDLHINTTDATVGTVIDQTYVKNMPLNGRSFQDLILLTPGVVTNSPQNLFSRGLGQTGEFSVNGQRTEDNYYTVDGVSANVGATSGPLMYQFAGTSGSLPGATALGTTQALVSVDDLQEFRVQSSTYSAEYGRNPGGQFAFETKSGTNQWHGTAYDYFRNDVFDANDWFNGYVAPPATALPKAKERQNDFGGTLGGPVRIPRLYNGKDKTFFFVSYEGLRLLQPEPAAPTFVPSLCLRGVNPSANCSGGEAPAPSALQPVLSAFPVPTGPEVPMTGAAPFDGVWSNPSSIDSTSVRFDHVINDKMRLFFRFSDTASDTAIRGMSGSTPSQNTVEAYTLRTYTAGISDVFSNRSSNDFRLNYSSNSATSRDSLDTFGLSIPVDLFGLTGLKPDSQVLLGFLLNGGFLTVDAGQQAGSQRQWNLVDTLALSIGRHQLKFGADYRRLAPFAAPFNPQVVFAYFSESSVQQNNADVTQTVNQVPAYPLYRNFSAFAQDEWKVARRLSLSLGLRWEVNPAPGVTQGSKPYTIQGTGPDNWILAPPGTPLWQTTWFNFAPRLGAAYILRDTPGWQMVIRGGGGLFFDTGQQQGSKTFDGPGFNALANGGGPFPVFPAAPTIQNPPQPPYNTVPIGFPTHLQLPYTLQWNSSIEQALGKSQAVTLTYVGSHASRLLKFSAIRTPKNPNYQEFTFYGTGLSSDYDSLQVQFRRRLSKGLTALASYTWSHCLDYGSLNYFFGYQRGNCDFDLRHNVSGALSYSMPKIGQSAFVNALFGHWGFDDRFSARTGFPVTLNGRRTFDPVTGQQEFQGLNLVPNQPIYLYGANCDSTFNNLFGNRLPCPGGRAINPKAFMSVSSGLGDAPRNFVRGFGAWQMDLAVRREFPIYENLSLQFRAEAFNVFNHPNFGAINTGLGGSTFGQATATVAQSLGILSPLYQMGGPRSMQFSMRLSF